MERADPAPRPPLRFYYCPHPDGWSRERLAWQGPPTGEGRSRHASRTLWRGSDGRRLVKLLNAKVYRDRPHLVLELDTAMLLRRHAGDETLSALNSGAAFAMNPAPRPRGTFRRIEDHPADRTLVELTIAYAVHGAADLTIRVSRWRGGERLGEFWRRD